MTRRQGTELTRRVLHQSARRSLETADGVWTESRNGFVSPERHDADLAMFRRVPHVVAWAGEIPTPGSFTTKDVMGVPVLLTRTRAGDVRAFINACAHRGAQVAHGCGVAQRLACGYHGWTYRLDGRLAGAPGKAMFEGAELETLGLVSLPVSDRCGLITIGLGAGVDLDGYLDAVAPELEEYTYGSYHAFGTQRFELQANWKLAVDVNFEGYHFPFAHKDTLSTFMSNHSAFDTYGRHARWAFPFRDIAQFAERPESEWPDQFHGSVVYGLFPSCVLVETAGVAQMLRIYPGRAPGESVAFLTYGTYDPVPEASVAYHVDAMESVVALLRDEDFPQAEQCQRGIEAGVQKIHFGRNEPLLHHFASAWQQALLDQDLPDRAPV